MKRLQQGLSCLLLALLGGCSTVLPPRPAVPVVPVAPPAPAATHQPALPDSVPPPVGALLRGKSRWVAADWRELPGFEADALHEAWNAFVKSCERPNPSFAPLCPEVRRLSIGDAAAQRDWLQQRLQPYRVEPLQGPVTAGLLTAYFEPEFAASRLPDADFRVPMYQPPGGLSVGKAWFSRRDIDTQPQAQAALRGKEIVYLADPVQALVLQIQGSGRVRVSEPDGTQRLLRLAYAGNNGWAYQSVGRWLLDQGELQDASWPGIANWLAKNPQRVNELLWTNPRVVFFKEEPLGEFDAAFGPRGAQGVALTPGRSIAVDPDSIPYGTPVWLASQGSSTTLQRLVLAQDTGNAISGALRADYFVGWGVVAGELAGRMKQPLQLWVLWPKPPG